MIHPKTPSTTFSPSQNKRSTNVTKNLVQAVKTVRIGERPAATVPNDVEESDTLGFFEAIEQEKARADMDKLLENRKIYPIAPDGFIPNSILRSMFKMKEIEPVEVKMFRLRMIPSSSSSDTLQTDRDERLKRCSVVTNFDGIYSTIFQALHQIDILDNLQSKTNKNRNWQNDDDEWVELGDPDASLTESTSKPTSAKKSKHGRPKSGTMVSHQKDSLPDVFKRMKNESWWEHFDEDGTNNLRSMLMYLIDVLRDKEQNSYESACNYVVEVFRTYGIEPSLVDQILGILTDHLALSENDPLDSHTVRTIAQFMMERKHIIIALLSFASKYQPNDILRHETINAIKFITDVNSTDDIDLALNNMPIVRDAAHDTFSLKTIIENLRKKQNNAPSNLTNEGEDEGDSLHPLLRKISDERWFPRDNNPVTLDSVIDAILSKLPTASKSLLKTLTTHLVQLQRMFGYSKEQCDRVSNGLIALFAHNDADYRLIAATVLANLDKETKAVDIALLNSFLNDPRILVRTECGESLKKLTGVMSETVLKDCADEISYLQTLPEENFSLQDYLKEKNRLPTPPTIDEPPSVIEEEQQQEEEEENTIPTHEDRPEEFDTNIDDYTSPPPPVTDEIAEVPSPARSRSPSPYYEEEPQPTSGQFSVPPSLNSATTAATPIEPSIRVEISEKSKSFIPLSQQTTQLRKELPPPPPPPSSSSQPTRGRQRQLTEPLNRTSIRITLTNQSTGRRSLLLPNSSEMWDSYAKQNEINEELESEILASTEIHQEQIPDPIQTILDDHKRHIGYYRMHPNRPVLIPHKISFDDIFADQSHMTVDRKAPFPKTSYGPPHAVSRSVSRTGSTMHLSDLNRNKHHLQEVEFVQLLSSMIIRAIQIHRQHERFIPGPYAMNTDSYISFTDALSISQMQLHSPTSLDSANFYAPSRLPPITRKRRSSAEMARMKTDTHIRAKRTGISLRKARDMEDALSHVLVTDREKSPSTFVPMNTPHPSTLVSSSDSTEVTHAWLLEQLLKSQGASNSPNYIHQIIRAYPKFMPLLHSRVPRDLIPIIWNDPVLKKLASIVGNKSDESSLESFSPRRVYMKPAITTIDDDHSSNLFDFSTSSVLLNMQQQQQRDEQKKKHLPPVRRAKMRLPRHVLKFGFRELESDSPETSLDSLRDENISKSRRRRIYMHLMMSVNENMLVRHELVKKQYRHMLKTDCRSPSFLPIIVKPPPCN